MDIYQRVLCLIEMYNKLGEKPKESGGGCKYPTHNEPFYRQGPYEYTEKTEKRIQRRRQRERIESQLSSLLYSQRPNQARFIMIMEDMKQKKLILSTNQDDFSIHNNFLRMVYSGFI